MLSKLKRKERKFWKVGEKRE